MERKEFKRRLSGLFAWMLVMILVVNNTQGGRISVHAEDVTGSSQVKQIEVPVTYYDIYSADDPSKSVLISQTANENGAIITSSEYSESVILNEYDSTLMQTDIQLPVAEKEGYILAGWELYGCDYVEADMPEESFWDVGVAASEIEAFAFVAVWVEALRNTITYDFTGATMNGVADTFSYEIVQPDADTYEFVENVTTLIPTMPGKVFTGWTPAETDKNIYDAQAGTITGTYGEGGDSTLYANWRDEGTITVEYLISDYYSDWGELGDDIVPVTFYEGETAEPVITLPLPIPFEGYAFRSWSCVDENAGQYLTDLLGYNEEIDGYPAGTVFRPEYTVDESTGNVNQAYSMYASFTTAEYLTVLYDLNGGQGLESTEDIVYQKEVIETEATFTLPEAPTHDTYTFRGWLCDLDGEMYEEGAEASCAYEKGMVTFIAQWECEIPITYHTAGGTITSTNYDTSVSISIDATSADGVILPTVEKDGSFFLDWELEISGGGTYGTGTQDISWDSYTPASSVTEMVFTAEWQEAIASAITYEFSGGMMNGYVDSYVELVAQETINSVDFEVPVTTYKPTKVGYMFTDWEWQASETGSGSYEGGKISGNYGENYKLVAKWRPENTISITASMASGFEDVGTIESGMSKTYGESIESDGNGNALINLSDVKEIKDGYFFVGWKCFDENGKEVILDGYIEMTDYDGSVIECYPSGTLLSIAYPTDDNNSGGNSASYTLEAQFKKASRVKVTYDLNGGSGNIASNDIVYQEKYGDATVAVYLPEAPTRDGYEFLGWKYNNTNYIEVLNVDVTLGEITLVADWKKIIEAGKVLLKAGEEYRLAEGNWTVDGDTTVYVGGSNFYVSEEAEYIFTQK